MDIRLPAQLGRPLQVAGSLRLVPPVGQAVVVDPPPVRPLERPIRRPLPRLADLLQPLLGHRHTGFPCSALLRFLGEELARKVSQHDQAIGILFEHIQGLLGPPEPPRKHPIGFRVTEDDEH